MCPTRKSAIWYFDMKAPVGGDAEFCLAYAVDDAAVDVHDIGAAHTLLNGGE